MNKCRSASMASIMDATWRRLGIKSLSFLILGLLCTGCSDARKATPSELPPQAAQGLEPAPPAGGAVPLSFTYTPDTAVLQAYEAMKARDWEEVLALSEAAQRDKLLGAYPMYWYLREQLKKPISSYPVRMLQDFISKYQGQYAAERLRAEWIKAAMKSGDFETVLRLQPISVDDNQAICAIDQAKAVSGTTLSAPQEIIRNFKPGDNCWGLLSTVYNQGYLSFELLQPLFRNAVEYDNKNSARRFAAMIFSPEQLDQYDAIIKDPRAWIMGQDGPAADHLQEELRAVAFSRLARQDRFGGIEILRSTTLLKPQDKQWAFTQFALVAALNHEQQAHEWYQEGGNVALSDYNAAWRVRAALYQPRIDWQWVKQSIEMMSPSQQEESAWLYWKGRAVQAMGRQDEAYALYKEAVQDTGFYSQLALEEMGKSIYALKTNAWPTEANLRKMVNNVDLQRALALFQMGDHPDAVAQWNEIIRNQNEEELLASAQLALENKFWDRAVNTSDRTKSVQNLEQRYPTPFEQKIRQQAWDRGIDPAWVYGLIRQESRFVKSARSPKGAGGMMQIMPATAVMVARQIGVDDFNPASINDFDINALLGTTYMRSTLDKVGGSELAATAGYNAGPNRALLWKNNFGHPVEGAIFAETIPFTETRVYTKNVMSNLANYSLMLRKDQPFNLHQRLGTIK